MNSDKGSLAHTALGFVILAMCCVFVVSAYYRSGNNSAGNKEIYTIHAPFERADGIDIGSKVSIAGISIGRVSKIELDQKDFTAVLYFDIYDKYKIPLDSSAEIVSSGFLGEKYISIVPGAEKTLLKNGGAIEFTQSSLNLEGIVNKLLLENNDNSDDSKSKDDSKDSESAANWSSDASADDSGEESIDNGYTIG